MICMKSLYYILKIQKLAFAVRRYNYKFLHISLSFGVKIKTDIGQIFAEMTLYSKISLIVKACKF